MNINVTIPSSVKHIASGNIPTTSSLSNGEVGLGKITQDGRHYIFGNDNGEIVNYTKFDITKEKVILPSVIDYINEPTNNIPGERYLVDSRPTGVFENALWGDYAECQEDGTWKIFHPINGQEVIISSSGAYMKYNRAEIPTGNAWQTLFYVNIGMAEDETEAISLSTQFQGKLFIY